MLQTPSQRAPGFLLAAIVLSALSCGGAPLEPSAIKSWTLVWSDEFNGAGGSAPDASQWAYDTGGKGWGNNELECYTNRLHGNYWQGPRHSACLASRAEHDEPHERCHLHFYVARRPKPC